MAVDDGTPALSASQILTIIVLDVNDEPPVFTEYQYQASVSENKAPGEFVIKITATDKDSGIQLCPRPLPPRKTFHYMKKLTLFLSPFFGRVTNC